MNENEYLENLEYIHEKLEKIRDFLLSDYCTKADRQATYFLGELIQYISTERMEHNNEYEEMQ